MILFLAVLRIIATADASKCYNAISKMQVHLTNYISRREILQTTTSDLCVETNAIKVIVCFIREK